MANKKKPSLDDLKLNEDGSVNRSSIIILDPAPDRAERIDPQGKMIPAGLRKAARRAQRQKIYDFYQAKNPL